MDEFPALLSEIKERLLAAVESSQARINNLENKHQASEIERAKLELRVDRLESKVQSNQKDQAQKINQSQAKAVEWAYEKRKIILTLILAWILSNFAGGLEAFKAVGDLLGIGN